MGVFLYTSNRGATVPYTEAMFTMLPCPWARNSSMNFCDAKKYPQLKIHVGWTVAVVYLFLTGGNSVYFDPS